MLPDIILGILALSVVLGLFAPPIAFQKAGAFCRLALYISGVLLSLAVLLFLVFSLEAGLVAAAACESFFMAAVWLSASESKQRHFYWPSPAPLELKIDWEGLDQARTKWSDEIL